ncbi:MAG TPA: AsmA-like C-terminal domain-containing protein [Pirellulales bacterium]|nr:AsmA-like C-terminal domain-containing protein [Pirellulales bacterium]
MLLAAIAIAAGVSLFYQRFDDEIRRRVEARIAEQYPHLTVSARAARFLPGKGIEVRGLSITDPKVSGPTAEMLYVEELLLEGNTAWRQLLQGDVPITRVVVRRPTLRVARRADGTWSAGQLLPLPQISKDPPRGLIENGVIEILDLHKQQGGSLIVRDAQLTVEAEQAARSPRPAPRSRREATPAVPLRLAGHFTADHVQRVDVQGTFMPSGDEWSLAGMVEGLDFSPEFVRALPAVLSRRLSELGSLRCEAKGRFELSRTAAEQGGFKFDVGGQISRGRVDDPRLPYPLTDLRAAFHADNNQLAVTDLTARNGQTTLALDLHREGYVQQSPYTLVAKSRRMVFDQQLRSILPFDWQSEWNKFMPAGEFDADLTLNFDGENWRPELTITCKNVSFSHHKFPYRLERAHGRVELKDKLVTIDLKAFTEGELVRVQGQYHNPGAQAVGWLNVRGDNVRLDEKLFLALTDNCRRIVRSLNPRGTFNVAFDVWHGQESPPKIHKRVVLSLNRCSLRYDQFPYPLDNIRGTIVVEDDVWQFKDLEGTNDTGVVECHGRLVPGPAGNDLELSFNGRGLALEDELRDALAVQSAAAARFWRDLRPRGMMNVVAILHYEPAARKPSLTVTLRPVHDAEGSTAVSIEPAYFPYKLEKLRGVFTYQQGRVTLKEMHAEHRTTRLSAEGKCLLDGEGGWQLHFDRLEVDRLRADRELLSALSGGLKRTVTGLQPRGAMSLHGKLVLASNGQSPSGLAAQWNLGIEGHQVSIDCGVPLENIFGAVQLYGSFDGQQLVCNGELSIDSMTYKNFQFTQCLGPFWLDNNVVLLGRSADRQRASAPGRAITASLYGGTAVLGGRVTLGEVPKYAVYATLTGADLARCAQEAIAGKQKLSGVVSANVDLHGAGRGIHHLDGRGSVSLTDADLFELPVIVALLKPLSGRLPDTTAFNTANVDFRIEGEHVYLNKIHLNGDAVSLRGSGEMGLDRSIQLSFYAKVGRGEAPFPLLDKVVSAASQQIMQIHVTGTLDNPVTRNAVFPNVEEAGRVFQPDSAPRAGLGDRVMGRAAPAPQTRRYGFDGPK